MANGSSPRVRGRPTLRNIVLHREGLIPAGAGQTRRRRRWRRGMWAHPRGCGADVWVPVNAEMKGGSSPRVRGRLQDHPVQWGAGGLIPAGAGQTDGKFFFSDNKGAHPRGCGADGMVSSSSHRPWGSSPRVRGRPLPLVGAYSCHRLIPAGAGQTLSTLSLRGLSWAHPRGCGADRSV